MSFLAPYAFTGAVSLYLGYKTYSSYYSQCDFEEIPQSEIDEVKREECEIIAKKILDECIENSLKELNQVPITRQELVNEGKKRGEEIKVIIEEVQEEENIKCNNYENITKVVNKTLEKIKDDEKVVEEKVVEEKVVSKPEIPELVFPEVETKIAKKKNGKKKKKKNKKK